MRERPLVLVVDDEENFLEIISENLKNSGFDPVVARNATEAVEGCRPVVLRPYYPIAH